MSATIRRATTSGCISAACIAALPPIECPSSTAGSAPSRIESLQHIGGHGRISHVAVVRARAMIAQIEGNRAPMFRERTLHAAEIASRTEQSMQQHERRTALPCLDGVQHHRRVGHAAAPTPKMISAEPASRSAVIGSPSMRLARIRLIAGVVRKPTEDTTAGSVAVA